MPKIRIVKWGSSLAVRIPKEVAQKTRMKEGDAIVIEAEEDDIRLRRAERVPTLKELVTKITPDNRHAETDLGQDVGKEVVEW